MPREGRGPTSLRRCVAAALIGGALAAATGSSPAGAAAPTQSTSAAPAAAEALIARLAVLRRPQTSQDVLPASPAVAAPPFDGVIIPSLTRLVSASSSLRLYLVVTTPARGADQIWSPRLGDQVALVSETAHGASEGEGAPAADLSDGLDVQTVGVGAGNDGLPLENAAIIPDGVAFVRWTFDRGGRRRGLTIDIPVSDNLATYPFSRPTAIVVRARWFAADGATVATSNAALRRALAQEAARRRAAVLRYDRAHPVHVARLILDRFSVFAIRSRAGIRLADGVVVSWPRLTALPLGILELSRSFGPRQLVDPADMRQVTTPSGVRFWVAAGPRTACVYSVQPPGDPRGLGDGASGGCAPVSAAGGMGLSVTFGLSSGRTIAIRVLPVTHPTVTVRTAHGRRTIRPPDGIYVTVRRGRPHPGSGWASFGPGA